VVDVAVVVGVVAVTVVVVDVVAAAVGCVDVIADFVDDDAEVAVGIYY
jgi:hypothetical protein